MGRSYSCFYLFTMWKRYWHLGMITRKINSKLGWCSYLEHATHSTKCVYFSFDDQKYWVHLDRQQKEWSCRNMLDSCSWYCACNYTTNLIKLLLGLLSIFNGECFDIHLLLKLRVFLALSWLEHSSITNTFDMKNFVRFSEDR